MIFNFPPDMHTKQVLLFRNSAKMSLCCFDTVSDEKQYLQPVKPFAFKLR